MPGIRFPALLTGRFSPTLREEFVDYGRSSLGKWSSQGANASEGLVGRRDTDAILILSEDHTPRSGQS